MKNLLLIALIIILIIIIYIIIVCVSKTNKKLRAIIIKAILFAERQYNSTTGKERLNIAVNYVMSRLPDSIQKIIPKELLLNYLVNIVQKIFDETKELLDYRPTEILEESEVVNNEE